MTRPDARQIEQYLLGSLSEEETSRFDRLLLKDPRLFSAVEATEDDLIDRYVRGELPPDDRQRFEERLLSSGRVRRRVGFARALRDLAERAEHRQEHGAGVVGGADRRTDDPGGTSPGPFSVRLAWAACLIALLGAGLLALVNLRLQDRLHSAEELQRAALERLEATESRAELLEGAVDRSRLDGDEAERLRTRLREREERIAALERRVEEAVGPPPEPSSADQTSPAVEPGTHLFLALATRAGGELATVERPIDGPVELQLGLDRLSPERSLVVTIRRNGTPIWRRTGLEPETLGPEGMVSLSLPEPVLFPGDYRVEVAEEGVPGTTPLATYDFRVE